MVEELCRFPLQSAAAYRLWFQAASASELKRQLANCALQPYLGLDSAQDR